MFSSMWTTFFSMISISWYAQFFHFILIFLEFMLISNGDFLTLESLVSDFLTSGSLVADFLPLESLGESLYVLDFQQEQTKINTNLIDWHAQNPLLFFHKEHWLWCSHLVLLILKMHWILLQYPSIWLVIFYIQHREHHIHDRNLLFPYWVIQLVYRTF